MLQFAIIWIFTVIAAISADPGIFQENQNPSRSTRLLIYNETSIISLSKSPWTMDNIKNFYINIVQKKNYGDQEVPTEVRQMLDRIIDHQFKEYELGKLSLGILQDEQNQDIIAVSFFNVSDKDGLMQIFQTSTLQEVDHFNIVNQILKRHEWVKTLQTIISKKRPTHKILLGYVQQGYAKKIDLYDDFHKSNAHELDAFEITKENFLTVLQLLTQQES